MPTSAPFAALGAAAGLGHLALALEPVLGDRFGLDPHLDVAV
jgi:hypothetical protein